MGCGLRVGGKRATLDGVNTCWFFFRPELRPAVGGRVVSRVQISVRLRAGVVAGWLAALLMAGSGLLWAQAGQNAAEPVSSGSSQSPSSLASQTASSAASGAAAGAGLHALAAFPLDAPGGADRLAIQRPVRAHQPFTVAGERGMLVGREAGSFEAWILPVKLLSHMAITAQVEGYPVPIDVNEQAASIRVHPDHTVITYAHIGFTLRQIMLSPSEALDAGAASEPATGPVVLFQVDAQQPVDFTFRFRPEMLWMWPKRNGGVPSPEWVARGTGAAAGVNGYYVLHLDYPDLAGAVTIPGAEPGVMAPYQERPQVHPLELHLHYDPKRDGARYFPLLMAVGATPQSATNEALGATLGRLNARIPAMATDEQKNFARLLEQATRVETPDAELNQAFAWAEVSLEQLKAHGYESIPGSGETALVAGYYESGDSARPGFGWFFGRDALYALYAVNAMGDYALTREELDFLAERQRADGKIMHEYSQTAYDPEVHWRSFPYMYAAADATPLYLLAVRDYLRSSGDRAWLKAHRAVVDKAWAFETAATSDTDHDGIFDNSQGTGWVESWPGGMPHQEVYLALLDEQASVAYGELADALGEQDAATAARTRAARIATTIGREYAEGDCYAFSHGMDGRQDETRTVFPAIGWWDKRADGTLPTGCLRGFADHALETDWGLRDVNSTEAIFNGMSYHQGSVWPLFTGWAAMAEYGGGQPLAGEQMLRENVNLTWASDLGAVTELLSGDRYVPFGRSTSHQLWSSAMVVEPMMRGMLGLTPDALHDALTLNPQLPANWKKVAVEHLHVGGRTVRLEMERRADGLIVSEQAESEQAGNGGAAGATGLPKLRSDLPGAQAMDRDGTQLRIPLPAVEVVNPAFALPEAGARSAEPRVLAARYSGQSLELTLEAPAGSVVEYGLVATAKKLRIAAQNGGVATLRGDALLGRRLQAAFGAGTGWQTMTVTLSWSTR